MTERTQVERSLERWCWIFTLAQLLAAPAALIYTGELGNLAADFWRLMVTPSPLVTDYFMLGSMGASFLNGALCSAFVLVLARLLRVPIGPGMTVPFMLVAAHCYFGMNLLTLVLCVLAALAGVRLLGPVKNNLAPALLVGCMGPFLGELMFRYGREGSFVIGRPHLSWIGLAAGMGMCVLFGAAAPIMLPGAKRMHKGFDLYNAGVGIGLLSMLFYGLLYPILGKDIPAVPDWSNPVFVAHGGSYRGFMNVFFLLVFGAALLAGWYQNGRSLRGYGALVRHSGYDADFVREFGTPLCLINIGVYGLFILGFMDFLSFLPGGLGFNGPTIGVVIAALTFVVLGQDPGDVWPIMLGYLLLGGFHWFMLGSGEFLTASQAQFRSFAFATGLCPIAGKYGWGWGVAAGFICGALAPLTNGLHGGLMLFNGGLAAGLAAMILLPIVEHIKK